MAGRSPARGNLGGVLTPFVFARKALRLMNAKNLPAFGAGPPCLFVLNKTPHAEVLYILEILNHAHTILCFVPLIQVSQRGTRKGITTEAVPDVSLHDIPAVLDSAGDASFRFDTVVAPATGACVLFSIVSKRHAQAAIHAAWSNQRRSHRICAC